MIFVGVIIIIGVLLLVAAGAFFVHRRSVLVDQRQREIADRKKQIHQHEQQLRGTLVESLLAGKDFRDAVPTLIEQRAALLPDLAGSAGEWTTDDVNHVLDDQLRGKVDDVNRRLVLPMVLTFLAIIAATIITATTLYAFIESSPIQNPMQTKSINSIDPYDPFALDPFAPTDADTP